MTTSPRRQGVLVLSLLFAAAPFGAGLIRAVQTGSDMRLLLMAAGALIGGVAAMAIGKSRSAPASLFSSGILAFVLAALLTAGMGILVGARSGPGVWMIAVVFGLCWAVSYALFVRSRAIERPRDT